MTMNEKLAAHSRELILFAKGWLKRNLALCSEAEQTLFKRMYSADNLALPIDEVVDNMPSEKLDWAMTQVQRTLKSNKES